MDTTKILIWVVVFGVSMGLAALVMRFYDNTRANIATRKIIGSTREERKRTDLLKSLISRVSFNKDETKKKLVSAGIYSDFPPPLRSATAGMANTIPRFPSSKSRSECVTYFHVPSVCGVYLIRNSFPPL